MQGTAMPLTKPGSGELTEFVTIVRHYTAPASSEEVEAGKPVLTDLGHEVRTIKGKLEAVGALTYWGAVQTGSSVTHKLYMRTIPGLTDVRSLNQVVEFRISGETYKLVRVQALPGVPAFVCCDVTNLGANDPNLITRLPDTDVLGGTDEL